MENSEHHGERVGDGDGAGIAPPALATADAEVRSSCAHRMTSLATSSEGSVEGEGEGEGGVEGEGEVVTEEGGKG